MEFLITRHPVFNKNMEVHSYLLDFYSDNANGFDKQPAFEQKISKIITDGILSGKFEELTFGKPAQIIFPGNLLKSGIADLIPGEFIKIVIADNSDLDNNLYQRCNDLKKKGYDIILKNFSFKRDQVDFLPALSMVEVDCENTGDYVKQSAVRKLKNQNFALIAGNVFCKECFSEMLSLDYDLFEGDFFKEANFTIDNDIKSSKINHLQILKEVNSPDADFRKLESIIKRDVSLSYRLLKLVNSSFYNRTNEIHSIRDALTFLGLETIKKWTILILLGNLGSDKPLELLYTSLTRAKFMENIAYTAGYKEHKENLYILGLFSLLDVFLDKPLSDILNNISLEKNVEEALLGHKSDFSNLLLLTREYEKGNWEKTMSIASEYKLENNILSEKYLNANRWSREIISSCFSKT